MGYDRGDSFSFDFESNGIPFGSKSKGKLSPRSYPIQFERKWKYSFLSVGKAELNTCHVWDRLVKVGGKVRCCGALVWGRTPKVWCCGELVWGMTPNFRTNNYIHYPKSYTFTYGN